MCLTLNTLRGGQTGCCTDIAVLGRGISSPYRTEPRTLEVCVSVCLCVCVSVCLCVCPGLLACVCVCARVFDGMFKSPNCGVAGLRLILRFIRSLIRIDIPLTSLSLVICTLFSVLLSSTSCRYFLPENIYIFILFIV